ncbi:MAG TPA: DUF4190 domain-containing protein [Pyrinomonadaceae bacterium]|nr:DUF4190 domain-containing protein [Pyrinomonadaceae bacterium]
MKRCPTCDKTFDDNMRFCQADGTPLVDDVPVDPYKTMMARPEDIAAAMPREQSEDLLDLPAESDPAKTMYASESEIRSEMAARDEQVIDIPPLVDPEPPQFNEPAPPPSPFSVSDSGNTVPPIPSPFDEPKRSTYDPPIFDSPTPSFAEPDPVHEEPSFNPFEQQASAPIAQAEWAPPPAPDAGWQNQQIGQNTPFQPPPAGTGSVNQTLPIISLVLGIVSLCCYIGWLTGPAALITGFLSLKNINRDPAAYGGKTLAIIGMILGGIFTVLWLIYWIFIILVYAGLLAGSMMPSNF